MWRYLWRCAPACRTPGTLLLDFRWRARALRSAPRLRLQIGHPSFVSLVSLVLTLHQEALADRPVLEADMAARVVLEQPCAHQPDDFTRRHAPTARGVHPDGHRADARSHDRHLDEPVALHAGHAVYVQVPDVFADHDRERLVRGRQVTLDVDVHL